MGFSHEHRWKKAHDIHYSYNLKIKDILPYTNEPEEVLQAIYDEEYAKTHRNRLAINAVFGYLNRKQLQKNKSSENPSDSDQKKLLLLSLYTMFPPRRNLDFIEMVVRHRMPGKLPTQMNYLVISKKKMRFVFEVYKTAGAYGRQVFDVPDDLRDALIRYLKTQNWTDEENRPLLGAGLQSNYITKQLNEVFAPKKIGSSMLRHIYASGKYGGAEHQEALAGMMDDADKMAHSIGAQQLIYTKTD